MCVVEVAATTDHLRPHGMKTQWADKMRKRTGKKVNASLSSLELFLITHELDQGVIPSAFTSAPASEGRCTAGWN